MTTTATTVPALDARVSLLFARKGRTPTHWIEGEFPVDARPDALFAALAGAGWLLDPLTDGIPAYDAYDMDATRPLGQQMVPRGYQVKDFMLVNRGTDLFGGWTEEEKQTNMRRARAVLRRFGFTGVPVWSKTLSDML